MPAEARGSPSSWIANLLLLGSSLIAVALIFALTEGILRLAGIGAPDASRASRLKYQQVFLPILEPAERADGTAVYRTLDPRLPYQFILADKPADSLRIFTFGGSATAGLGFSPNVTFARHLERMLEQAYPDRTVEVVNLGIVALSSRQVARIVADVCMRFEPDVLIVYSGNNEFLEVHAEKYAQANATLLSYTTALLGRTHLYRALVRIVRGPPRAPSLAEQKDLSNEDLRLTQARIIEQVAMSPDEIGAVIDEYEANLDEIARVATTTDVPLLLMSVASNWEWRGRSDLPENWLGDLVGHDGGAEPEQWQVAVDLLGRNLDAAPAAERHDRLYKRALAKQALRDSAGARADFRAALEADPHLRRALDAMNSRVELVARRHGVDFVDSVDVLASHAPNGIIGFREFYDYVHFTPTGAIWLARALFGELEKLGIIATGRVDPARYVSAELADLRQLSSDFLDVERWLGIGFEPARVHERDLWKYDRMLVELDERLEHSPDDGLALAYRGNAAFFRSNGAEQAARDYRRALELLGDPPVLRANLDRLLTERSVAK